MQLESMALARQVEFVFRQLEGELTNATAGTVLIHVRNNSVGKFGLRHHPIESKNGKFESGDKGLSAVQVQAFKQMAIESLKFRKDWSHGEILYDFSVRSSANTWSASILFESNYNMANWNSRYYPKKNDLWDSSKQTEQ